MKPYDKGAIYQVQLTNEALLQKLFESKVNDYVTLGFYENEHVSGRLVYRSEYMIHISLIMYYVMVDIKTKMAYFVDMGFNSSLNNSENLINNRLVDSLRTGHLISDPVANDGLINRLS